jgi:hypothetical protein
MADILHVMALFDPTFLYHGLRNDDQAQGTFGWFPFDRTDVKTQLGYPTALGNCACAANQFGNLHICDIDQGFKLVHTVRQSDGTWPYGFEDVQSQTVLHGPRLDFNFFSVVACATSPETALHICVTDQNGALWQAIRFPNGAWPFGFEDVLKNAKAHFAPIQHMACAANRQGDLHICFIDKAGYIWHTTRFVDGTWQLAYEDILAQTGSDLPNAGTINQRIACATNLQGDLHICLIDKTGNLWHTIRLANGTWPYGLGDVQNQTRRLGTDIHSPLREIACSTSPTGELHICVVTSGSNKLWYTFRDPNGNWYRFEDVAQDLGYEGNVVSVSISHDPLPPRQGPVDLPPIERGYPGPEPIIKV